jgi:pimeloyl-ACP methyl ester carboxylesterase
LVTFTLFSLGTALLSTGCSVADLDTRQRQERGLVVVLPGIEGKSLYNVHIARGLDEGGVKQAIEIFDWTTAIPGGALINLTDLERNRQMAEVLSSCILQYRFHHPEQPIHLVAHSGGAGVAILTLEALPEDVNISTVTLLAAAVSPSYDLRAALQRTQYGIYNYYSAYDRFLLDVGTRVFGTVDRVHGAAAGSVGFRMAWDLKEPRDRALYRKVHNISWQPEMREYGNWGGHVDWANRRWVSHYLAPLIEDPRPLGANPVDSPVN